MFHKILQKAKQEHSLEKEEIIHLLNSKDELLYSVANEVRREAKGDSIHLRALIEFTNICNRNCYYCGLRYENKKVERYRLKEEQILFQVEKAISTGIKTIVLQGGEDSYWSTNKLCNLIKEIKKYNTALTLSIGERSYDDYKAFKNAGADRYLLRIETTDKTLYNHLHPNMSFENRIRCLKDLKRIGYETGTGSLVGLPKQTIKSLAEDIIFFKELNADMVGIGPFIPHPNTPLADGNKDNFDLALKVMSITRLLLPDINIPATTAMETLKRNGRIIALQSSANVVMINFTDVTYKKKYEIYPNKSCINESTENLIQDIFSELKSIGRTVSMSKGFRNDYIE